MKTIMFYSYKGGSGRTTTAANVAAGLTKLGKRVLCIDLDVDAPGLNIVFGIELSKNQHVIQDYLEETEIAIALEQLDTSRIDVLQAFRDKFEKPLPVSNSATLYLIPAKQEEEDIRALPLRGATPEARMRRLCTYYKNDIDFLILDSPSGLRSMSALALAISDAVLMFFTWSRQSLTGTILMTDAFDRISEANPDMAKPYCLIASQVPSPPVDWNELRIRAFQHKMTAWEQWLQEILGPEKGAIRFAVHENPMLKLDERVIVFDDSDKETDYDRIAKGLVARYPEGILPL